MEEVSSFDWMVKDAPKERKSEIKKGIKSNKDKTKRNISFWSWRKREQKQIREKRRERKKKKKRKEKKITSMDTCFGLYGI